MHFFLFLAYYKAFSYILSRYMHSTPGKMHLWAQLSPATAFIYFFRRVHECSRSQIRMYLPIPCNPVLYHWSTLETGVENRNTWHAFRTILPNFKKLILNYIFCKNKFAQDQRTMYGLFLSKLVGMNQVYRFCTPVFGVGGYNSGVKSWLHGV